MSQFVFGHDMVDADSSALLLSLLFGLFFESVGHFPEPSAAGLFQLFQQGIAMVLGTAHRVGHTEYQVAIGVCGQDYLVRSSGVLKARSTRSLNHMDVGQVYKSCIVGGGLRQA